MRCSIVAVSHLLPHTSSSSSAAVRADLEELFILPTKSTELRMGFEVSGSTCPNDREATTPTCFRPLSALWRDTGGSGLLEATLVIPVLLVLFLGTYEFSRYFMAMCRYL